MISLLFVGVPQYKAAKMSSTESGDGTELKAGHAPATKVGGMRVVQHNTKPPTSSVPSAAPEKTDDDEADGEKPAERAAHEKTTVISGAVVKDSDAFPTEAMQKMQQKPMPKHEQRRDNQFSSKGRLFVCGWMDQSTRVGITGNT